MPLFTEAGIQYPVPSVAKVVLRYFNHRYGCSEFAVGVTSNGADRRWSTLALITYSTLAKEQIIHEGSDRLTLTVEEQPNGPIMWIYYSILQSMEITYENHNPESKFPGLECASKRELQGDLRRALYMYRCLLNFALVPEVRMSLAAELKALMWMESNSADMPSPGWVHLVWTVLKGHDKKFVEETILAGTRTWKPQLLALPDLQVLRAIKKRDPDFWDGLDRAMAKRHWEGYGDWLIGRDGADSDDETEIMSIPPRTNVQASEDTEEQEVATPASEGNPAESSVLEESTSLVIAVSPSTPQLIVGGMHSVPSIENRISTIEGRVLSAEVTSSSRYVLIFTAQSSDTIDTYAYSESSLSTRPEGELLVVLNNVSLDAGTSVTEDTPSTVSELSPTTNDTLPPSERMSTRSEGSAVPMETSLARSSSGVPIPTLATPTSPPSPTTIASLPDNGSVDNLESVEDGYEADASSSPYSSDDERGRYLSPIPMRRSIKRSCSPFTEEERERSESRPRLSSA